VNENVKPALTVEKIMSRGGPQVLAPDTPVQEARERMQRYGYEGYPVVEDGRIIGLLTRRAVDRALSHKLETTARAVMEAGEVTIGPAESMERLQHLMTDTGWGQIPVLDPETGEIAGIVTRTDLLKTLAPQPAIPGRRNFSERLADVLQPDHIRLLHIVAAEAYEQRAALFIVGGFVRDLVLNHPSLDFDLVVEGDAIDLAKALAKKHGGRVTTHRRFGTSKWLLEPETFSLESIDLVTARTEFYTHPTALPTVERSSIKLDLHRRDFTLNTLALRLDGPHFGDLYDYWGGLNDLRQGIIRVLHSLSFVDDPTRMLRAVRFEQRFDFQIEARTLELLMAALGLLQRVSGDRIRHELDYMIDESNGVQMFSRLNELGLLRAIHPDLSWEPNGKENIFAPPEPESHWQLTDHYYEIPIQRALAYLFWLLHLPADKARKVTRRLKIRQALEAAILDACKLREDLPALAGKMPSEFTERLDKASLLAVYAVYTQVDVPELREKITTYVKTWRHMMPETDGHKLRALGLPPGPMYKTILTSLRTAWLNGDVRSLDEEYALLDRFIEDLQNG
jgi:tRNA nucleotidyltransferase (CCA-adding enzyme)